MRSALKARSGAEQNIRFGVGSAAASILTGIYAIGPALDRHNGLWKLAGASKLCFR